MPNSVKYNTSTETLSLKKGNFWIGIGDVDKGPTSSTGFYNGISPPSGGYTIYLNKASGGPSIYTVSNDAQLITLTNQIAGVSYTTVAECLVYFAGQSDKVIVNENYPTIITSGQTFNLDSSYLPSYPTSGNTWYNISVNSFNGTLTNGPTYNSAQKSIVFDGSDDYMSNSNTIQLSGVSFSSEIVCKPNVYSGEKCVFGKGPANDPSGGGIPSPQRKGIHWRLTGDGSTAAKIRFGFWSSDIETSGSPTILNKWTHIFFNYNYDGNNNSGEIYVNGVSQSVSYPFGLPFGPYIGPDTSTNYVGTWSPGVQNFNGNIQKFSLYNRTLSQSEILQNYFQGPIVTGGLVVAFDAGNLVSYESGSTTTYSLSGTTTGSLLNGVGYSNNDGGYWIFDGTDDWITFPAGSNFAYGTGDFTVECWFYDTSSTSVPYSVLYSQTTAGTNYFLFGVETTGSSGKVAWVGTSSGGGTGIYSSNTYSRNTWNHAVASRISGVVTVYLNGVGGTPTSNTVNFTDTTYVPTIGDESHHGSNYSWTGYIPIFRLYKGKGLTSSEVIQNYNAQKDRFGL